VGEGFVAAGFPIGGGLGFLTQHHCRAMGEEMDGWRHCGVLFQPKTELEGMTKIVDDQVRCPCREVVADLSQY
jgi:hypothetical protein